MVAWGHAFPIGVAGSSPVCQNKMITAVSELARNVVVYAGEPKVCPEVIEDGGRRGLAFEGQASGIQTFRRL
jgi:serine/threonine-protein kinase RsbT